ncbi:DUF4406 domain-containing protein [Brenneria populi subsp. brevivirga]|uniref:DUF4406 domain-containing protein n=1 Tax=Brenneria populi TaxID=1505588 RepID=UPI002E19D476|nr:DUF4406 domain-containing protein [Brenneria populi subsp. brevivirga]
MSRKPTVFISGPMNGREDYNRDEFNFEAKELEKQGFIVLNPAILPDGLEHKHYMAMSLAMLEQADAIYLLEGWEKSTGATLEFDRAKQRGLLFMYQSTEVFTAAVARFRRQKGEMSAEVEY